MLSDATCVELAAILLCQIAAISTELQNRLKPVQAWRPNVTCWYNYVKAQSLGMIWNRSRYNVPSEAIKERMKET